MPHCAENVSKQAQGPWIASARGTADEHVVSPEPDGVLSAFCRARSTRVRVSVLDISTTGCLLDLRTWGLKAGERLLIKLPGLSYLSAMLLWVEDGKGGLAFDHPLHDAVLRHLLAYGGQRFDAPRRGALSAA